MAVSDKQLIQWLGHTDLRVRSASLDLLSNSYASDPSILSSIVAAWDHFGCESAFYDFPLISHLAISSDQMPVVLARAQEMSHGRKITDRVGAEHLHLFSSNTTSISRASSVESTPSKV